eukprot:13424633-Alexandrium_andersonii.AAC.1
MIQWTDEVQAALSGYLKEWNVFTQHIGFRVRRTDYKHLSNSFGWTHPQRWTIADCEIATLIEQYMADENVVCHVR